MTTLTTRQAADLAGIQPSSLRGLVTRARQRGVELQLPREQWPDARTPMYDADQLRRYLSRRNERGTT